MVHAGEELSARPDDRERRRGQIGVVALRDEAPLLRRRVARRIEDDEVVPLAPTRRGREPGEGVLGDEEVLGGVEHAGGAQVVAPALERGGGGIDADRAPRAPLCRRGAEGARVRKEIHDARAARHLADPTPIRSLVEEQPGRETVPEPDDELHPFFTHDERVGGGHAANRLRRREVVAPRVHERVRLLGAELEVDPVNAERKQAVEDAPAPRRIAPRLRRRPLPLPRAIVVELRDEVPLVEIDRQPRERVPRLVHDAEARRRPLRFAGVAGVAEAVAPAEGARDRPVERGLVVVDPFARVPVPQPLVDLERSGCLDAELPTPARMREGEALRVQEEPRRARAPIQCVPRNRRSRVRELDARLMRSSGLQHELEKRARGIAAAGLPRDHAYARDGFLRPLRPRGDDLHPASVTREEEVAQDDPVARARPPIDRGEVPLLDRAPFELGGQRTVGFLSPRQDQHPARVAIEPLVNAEVFGPPPSPPEPGEEVVWALRIGGLGRHAVGLVHDEEVVVLVEDPCVVEVRPDAGAVHSAALHANVSGTKLLAAG